MAQSARRRVLRGHEHHSCRRSAVLATLNIGLHAMRGERGSTDQEGVREKSDVVRQHRVLERQLPIRQLRPHVFEPRVELECRRSRALRPASVTHPSRTSRRRLGTTSSRLRNASRASWTPVKPHRALGRGAPAQRGRYDDAFYRGAPRGPSRQSAARRRSFALGVASFVLSSLVAASSARRASRSLKPRPRRPRNTCSSRAMP
jgi:hypothetical protein